MPAVSGVLKGYDQLLNIVLDEALEYLRGKPQHSWHSKQPLRSLPGRTCMHADPEDPQVVTDKTRALGLIVSTAVHGRACCMRALSWGLGLGPRLAASTGRRDGATARHATALDAPCGSRSCAAAPSASVLLQALNCMCCTAQCKQANGERDPTISVTRAGVPRHSGHAGSAHGRLGTDRQPV